MNYDPLTTSWGPSIRLEQKVAQIIRQQEINGWLLDVGLVRSHINTLEEMLQAIDRDVLPDIPPIQKIPLNSLVSEPFCKDGRLKVVVERWASECKGPFSKVYWEPINLNSVEQVKTYLISVGWKPTEWNYSEETREKTSPKLSEDSFGSIKDGLGQAIVKRMMVIHRLGLLNGLLRDVRPDNRIEARANTVGTNTFRMRHSVVVNIPKPKDHVFFGKEIRACFIVPDGKVLIGVDAKGLENRMLCHYLNDPVMTKIILEGDFHTTVWNLITTFVSNRDTAKNVEYALFYGAQDEKLGKTADIRPKGYSYPDVGKVIRANIMRGLPSLDKLINRVQNDSIRGYLMALDGSKIRIRSKHSSFNALLQSAGALVMKVALCYLDQWIKQEKLDALFVGNWHDEFSLEVHPKDAPRVMELSIKSIVKAGEFFKLNVPLDGESKQGLSWAVTH